ncbi:hypothetical protein LEP1GSC127_1673 [Leptospira kirschneri str. 200801925]|nr:hypothetical protein LEP1GSC081_4129 [Leptospira kirschneri str. H1]EKO61701.1 hypothetical protein LEP1GSC082_1470 [Leptospira kirschneri str. H2]EMK06241.1 hypothetical protein LEP1GSC166_1053 [Leptospira kirschneri]EMK24585.1 hypothetical protein LEP1GSC008_1320 [Leptospira kirschneri serovar Bulgarica str. Nikolaevo]EMO75618.1 hypothetical protein LEP1GSC127_1673 [Leptospira kirschneri str. 200801925]
MPMSAINKSSPPFSLLSQLKTTKLNTTQHTIRKNLKFD